jgi:hypothetical protein
VLHRPRVFPLAAVKTAVADAPGARVVGLVGVVGVAVVGRYSMAEP